MIISIIHLTDLHLSSSNKLYSSKISEIVKAVRNDLIETSVIYFVISGDITNRGSEFIEAEIFIGKLKESLNRFFDQIQIKYIIVPGNHDCNFSASNQVRDIIINSIQSTELNDNSIIESCIKVQDDFWRFYEKIAKDSPENKLMYQIRDKVNNKEICFNCFNTAWMSSINEEVGKMYFPIHQISQELSIEDGDLVISVFHHPLNWFTPNTEPNNKKEFSKFLSNNSHLLISGHEHDVEHTKVEDLKTKYETIHISGEAFQNEKDKTSGFQVISINVNTKQGKVALYRWQKDKYSNFNQFDINCDRKKTKKKFTPIKKHLETLNNLNLPLKFETRKNVRLSEIFIYPDLEKISSKEKKIDEIYNSQRLLDSDTKIINLEGEAQSGKTSLINMLYLEFFDRGKYPLFIEARNLKGDIKRCIRKTFEDQYECNDDIFENYFQFSNKHKVLFIDNLQDYPNNGPTLVKTIKELAFYFDKIIIGTSAIYSFSSALNAEFKSIDYFFIQPLGYKRRNELIEKYHILNESQHTVTDQIILEKTKYYYDQVQSVLGNKLIPSYPVYILSILQTLIYTTPHNLEQTSLGYCYQSLLYVALTDKAKVKNEDVDSIFNFLSELAFNLYETENNSFSEKYLEEFYLLYRSKYITKGLITIKEILINSNIIIEDGDGDYRFRYNYIFYFLVSRRLVEIIHTEKGKEIVRNLCENLANEKAANVLIFATHYTKDNFLIDEATFSLMVPYNSYIPVTLDTEDVYYKLIEDIVKEISSNIIQANKDPKEERNKQLEAKDNFSINKAELTKDETNSIEINNEYSNFVEEMTHALKSLEIVGQIIKNRKGSIDKEKLMVIIKELYNTAFRTIGFFGEMSKLSQDELKKSLMNKVDEGDSAYAIEQKISNFFRYMTFQHCLGIFSKIVFSVGNKDLRHIFDDVAKEINTPAAKLVTFSIKSCYGKVSIKELKLLAEELKDNHVALSILRARVRAYVYNNHIDYKEKQQIASTMRMKIQS